MRETIKRAVFAAFPPIRRLRDSVRDYHARLEKANAYILSLQTEKLVPGVGVVELGRSGSFRPYALLSAIPGVSLHPTGYNDRQIVDRIVSAYRRAASVPADLGNSQWQDLFDQFTADLDRLLRADMREAVGAILRNPAATNILHGIDSLCAKYLLDSADTAACASNATGCLGSLVRCAEAMGAVPVFNPEWTNHLDQSPWTADAIVARIESLLGLQISFPNPYPNEHGALTNRGVASPRAVHALYQAWRISQLVRGNPSPRVLEIGAGLGRTGLYSRMLGIKDYTIIDLPIQEVSQAYFLAKTVGEDAVLLHGEKAADVNTRVKILPPEAFLAGQETYDVIVNVDSMTEMDINTARAYWNRIRLGTRTFLSINHERNSFTVKQLVEDRGEGIRAARHPYWMRVGYVEELFQST